MELICDGVHISPLAVQSVLDCNSSSTCVVTDAVAQPRRGKKLTYNRCRTCTVVGDEGSLHVTTTNKGNSSATVICGSCATMHNIFKKLVTVHGCSLQLASYLASYSPASIAGIDKVGHIRQGFYCDLVLMDSDLNIEKVMVSATVQFSRNVT